MLSAMALRLVAVLGAATLTSATPWGPRPWHGPHQAPQACGYQGGEPTATIEQGVVIGTTTSMPSATAPVNKYLGIPFAQSPPERFAPPQAPATYKSPLMAQEWKPACIQQFQYPRSSYEFAQAVFNNPPPEESEDCLYLNVYAPSTPAPSDGRAVLYWIYGGSLQFGNAGQPTYDGIAFAAYEDVIVVTVNYRTNVFGFPTSPDLPLEGHNLGFLDQRAGLDWVQQNIAAFGGSPAKVTIFGESAGAFSVDALLTSYPADSSPPFRGAILQSGQITYRGTPRAYLTESWTNLSRALDCPGDYQSDLACVRAAPATEIRRIIDEQSLDFNPVADNVTLVSDPAQRRASGNIARVPVLGGTDAQEGRVFTVGQNDTAAFLSGIFPDRPEAIAAVQAAYPLGSPGIRTSYDQIAQIYTEFAFQCSQALWANATAAVDIPTWRYYFNASFANTQGYPGLGVYHSSEIPIVFGTYPPANATTQEVALSRAMQGAWAWFARNPAAGPGWNEVGTGAAGRVLMGAEEDVEGGVYTDGEGDVVEGAWGLAVFGTRGDVLGSGVTVIAQGEVDGRCGLWVPVYEAIAAGNPSSAG